MGVFDHLVSQNHFVHAFVWVVKNYIEILATLTGFIYIFYSIKSDKLLWVFGFISSAIYVYVFLRSGLFADMGINFYYVVVSVYGWVHWTRRKSASQKEIPISLTNSKEAIIICIATLGLFAIIVFILKNFTNSTVPYMDAFTSAASITATWMLARKMLENWLFWIVVDAISVGLCLIKGLYPTAILFLVYTVLACAGFFEWKKLWKKQEAAQLY
jgi:nicotinamide mononucleotide transporter